MKHTNILSALFGFGIVLHITIIGKTFYLNSTSNFTSYNDSLLKITWNKFTKVVLDNDLKTFKTLSTECIYCSECVRNTSKEKIIFEAFKAANEKTWYNKLYSEYCYISIDKFINEDYSFIFTIETKSRMQDTSKFCFIENKHNSELYFKPCIIGAARENNLDFKEVLLTVVDSTYKGEGLQFAFTFVKISGQYKFCGFSTIP